MRYTLATQSPIDPNLSPSIIRSTTVAQWCSVQAAIRTILGRRSRRACRRRSCRGVAFSRRRQSCPRCLSQNVALWLVSPSATAWLSNKRSNKIMTKPRTVCWMRRTPPGLQAHSPPHTGRKSTRACTSNMRGGLSRRMSCSLKKILPGRRPALVRVAHKRGLGSAPPAVDRAYFQASSLRCSIPRTGRGCEAYDVHIDAVTERVYLTFHRLLYRFVFTTV